MKKLLIIFSAIVVVAIICFRRNLFGIGSDGPEKIMNKAAFLCVSALLLYVCCVKPDDKRTPSEYLEGTILTSDDFIGDKFVCLMDDGILMTSQDKKFGIVSYFFENDTTLIECERILRRGRGSNETDILYCCVKEDTLVVLDRYNGGHVDELIKIPLMPFESIGDETKWVSTDLQWLNPLYMDNTFDVVDGTESTFVLLAGKYDSKEILTIVDSETCDRQAIEMWFDDGTAVPDIVRQLAYMSNSAVTWNENRILYACGDGRFLQILQIEDGAISGIIPIYSIFPEYYWKDNGNVIAPIYVKGSYRGMDVFTTRNRIYIRLCNQVSDGYTFIPETYKGYPGYCFDEVEVYDWEGKFVTCYQTDIPFYDMIVSDDDSTMYIITTNNDTKEPFLVKYVLNEAKPI